MNEKYEQLIAEYLSGELDAAGKSKVEELIATGEIDFMEFRELETMYEDLNAIPMPKPDPKMQERFYNMLEEAKESNKKTWVQFIKEQVQLLRSEFTAPRLHFLA